MGKLINAKINLSKIDKTKLFTGAKGIYLDLSIWQNDTPDQFGNDFSIQQRTGKNDPKIYIGEGKYYIPKDQPESSGEWKGKKEVKSMSDSSELPQKEEDPLSDLPF